MLWPAPFVFVALLAGVQQLQGAPLEANQKATYDAPAAKPEADYEKSAIVDLLEQSHDLAEQLSVFVRVNLLPRQAQMAAELNTDLARQWSNELFALSLQVKGTQRTYLQSNSMGLLVRLDPDRALELLHDLSDEAQPGTANQVSPKMMLAQQVFLILIERDGLRALPLLQQEADLMGIQGHYPYAALGYAAMQATSGDWRNNKPHAIEVLRSVFEPAFARYTQNSHDYGDNLEFGRMLQVLAGGLPFDLVQPALHLLVERLLATDAEKYRFGATVYSKDGQKTKADNAIDASLLWFGSLINRDPELVRQLESSRPELAPALEFTKDGRRGSMFMTSLRSPPKDPSAETRGEAITLAHINPEAAVAKAQQLPEGEQRTEAILEVVREIARTQPEKAAQLMTEIRPEALPDNPEAELNLISARAAVASALGTTEELHMALSRGFELASRLVSGSQNTNGLRLIPALGFLVTIGIQKDRQSTIAFLQGLPASYQKADLLLGAASALQMQQRRTTPPVPQSQHAPS